MGVPELVTKAMQMTPSERAYVVEKLLFSLEPTLDEGVEESWRAETAKRLNEIDSGDVTCVPWERSKSQIEDLLNAR